MNKFKPGDRVMRIGGRDFPEYNMKRGGVYTVKNCNQETILPCESEERFNVRYFKLIDDTTFEGNV